MRRPNKKEEDSNLFSNISLLKIQNFNTKQPTICLGADMWKHNYDFRYLTNTWINRGFERAQYCNINQI